MGKKTSAPGRRFGGPFPRFLSPFPSCRSQLLRTKGTLLFSGIDQSSCERSGKRKPGQSLRSSTDQREGVRATESEFKQGLCELNDCRRRGGCKNNKGKGRRKGFCELRGKNDINKRGVLQVLSSRESAGGYARRRRSWPRKGLCKLRRRERGVKRRSRGRVDPSNEADIQPSRRREVRRWRKPTKDPGPERVAEGEENVVQPATAAASP